jgi:hypothetical protein
MAFYRLQYIKFILNFARLKNICGILTTYQGFCNLFFTAQNSAMPPVKVESPYADTGGCGESFKFTLLVGSLICLLNVVLFNPTRVLVDGLGP